MTQLIKACVPGEVLRAFTTGLGDFVDSGTPLWSLLLNKYSALSAYSLKLSSFGKLEASPTTELKALPQEDMQPTGWRFFAIEDDLYGGCHVGSIQSGLPPKLTGFSNSVQVLAEIEGYNGLTHIPLPPGNYGVRVLMIPWLQFEAFWLHWLSAAGSPAPDCDPNNPPSKENQAGTDVIVPYFGFVKSCSAGVLSTMQAYCLPDFLEAISHRAQHVLAQSLANQARIQQAQARRVKALADCQASSQAALQSQADALDRQARQALEEAARAQVRADVNRATADQVEIALGVSSAEAQAIVNHSKQQKGIHSWEDLGEVPGLDLKDRIKTLIGYGRRGS
jgi:DNA uptake protein ComE-like DNA-binding protein